MDTIVTSLDQSIALLKLNFIPIMIVIAVLWAVQIINKMLGYRLNYLGIYPRHLLGIPGIVFSPFLHKDFAHLFVNTIPLFILLNVLGLYGLPVAIKATIAITLISGAAIWVFGRRGIHVGASGLVMGYFGFALAGAIFTHNLITIVSAAVCFFYLGGILIGIFPSKDQVSWEGHLSGFLVGILYSYYLLG